MPLTIAVRSRRSRSQISCRGDRAVTPTVPMSSGVVLTR